MYLKNHGIPKSSVDRAFEIVLPSGENALIVVAWIFHRDTSWGEECVPQGYRQLEYWIHRWELGEVYTWKEIELTTDLTLRIRSEGISRKRSTWASSRIRSISRTYYLQFSSRTGRKSNNSNRNVMLLRWKSSLSLVWHWMYFLPGYKVTLVAAWLLHKTAYRDWWYLEILMLLTVSQTGYRRPKRYWRRSTYRFRKYYFTVIPSALLCWV